MERSPLYRINKIAWNPKVFMSFMLLFSSFFLFSQELIESDHIRVDPEWAVMHASYRFCWGYDVVTDQDGNVYSTGYFQRFLDVGSQEIYPENEGRRDAYFLMKHDSNGKFIWVSYARGDSRPCKVKIDQEGFVHVVGSVRSRELMFSSNRHEDVRLDKPEDLDPGIFVCKYDTSGKLIKSKFLPFKDVEVPNDFAFDQYHNLWICGNYFFRTFDRPIELKRSYFLMKLDHNWDVSWKEKGDTIGLSQLNALFIDDKDRVFITGSYRNNLLLLDHKLESDMRDHMAFVARLNTNGKLIWLFDGFEKFTGSGTSLVCDKKGNAYTCFNTSSPYAYLSKLNKRGKLKWLLALQDRSSNWLHKMLIDGNDGIYVCGEGYGGTFPSNGKEKFTYKTRGGTDIFFAKYNSKGILQWLKAGGGSGTDYCKSFALHNNSLYAFGWFGGQMEFFETALKSNSGYTFWLAKFDLAKLEYMGSPKR